MENIFQKIKRVNNTIDVEIEYKLNALSKTHIFLDFVKEYLLYGTTLLDYTQYRFYEKKNKDRRKYIVFGRLLEIMKICNNPVNRYIFDNKPAFNKRFKNYITREWLDLKTAPIEEFKEFVKKNE